MNEHDNVDTINALENEIEQLREQIKLLKKSTTITSEYGMFERRVVRRGEKRRQKTNRYGRNPLKLSLGWVGNIEFFCYPYDNMEKVYARIDNRTVTLDKYLLPQLFAVYNKGDWFLEHGKKVISGRLESDSPLAKKIVNAYNAGVERELEMDKDRLKEERKELLIRLRFMKPEARQGFFDDDPELEKQYKAYIKRTGYTENKVNGVNENDKEKKE